MISLFVALLVIVVLAFVLGWHLFIPIIGGIVAFTVTAWAWLVATVIALCVAIMLAFIFTGTGIFVLGILAFIWTVLAIIFFPVLFPIIAPIFLIFLFISYMRRRSREKEIRRKQENDKTSGNKNNWVM